MFKAPTPITLALLLAVSPCAFGQTSGGEASPPPPIPATEDAAPAEAAPAPATAATAPTTAPAPAPAPPASVLAPQGTAPALPAAASPATSPAPAPPPVAVVPPRKCKWEWKADGFYMRVLTSVGFTRLSGDGPTESARISGLGSGGIIAIGGSLTKGLVLAGMLQNSGVSAKFHGGPFADATFSANGQTLDVSQKATGGVSVIGALLDWYPMQGQGLHLGVGGGAGFLTVNNQADDSTLLGRGTSGTLLVGYDWAIAPEWAVGLTLVTAASTAAKLKYLESDAETGYKLSAFFIGLSGSMLYF